MLSRNEWRLVVYNVCVVVVWAKLHLWRDSSKLVSWTWIPGAGGQCLPSAGGVEMLQPEGELRVIVNKWWWLFSLGHPTLMGDGYWVKKYFHKWYLEYFLLKFKGWVCPFYPATPCIHYAFSQCIDWYLCSWDLLCCLRMLFFSCWYSLFITLEYWSSWVTLPESSTSLLWPMRYEGEIKWMLV